MSDFLFYGQVACVLVIGTAYIVKAVAETMLKRDEEEQRRKMVAEIEMLKRGKKC